MLRRKGTSRDKLVITFGQQILDFCQVFFGLGQESGGKMDTSIPKRVRAETKFLFPKRRVRQNQISIEIFSKERGATVTQG